ncbi:hypothetical protein CEXT_622221 [Caerostris extrusa]|uniref:Uncharacterized protein n=1 Tax=Caerostris extrusa TaxID=172846 RepID=A0AAV4Y648_CAEEX|nr:hypothetical protein CEXT_622221 [Caerostris extrusa]
MSFFNPRARRKPLSSSLVTAAHELGLLFPRCTLGCCEKQITMISLWCGAIFLECSSQIVRVAIHEQFLEMARCLSRK